MKYSEMKYLNVSVILLMYSKYKLKLASNNYELKLWN